MSNEKQELYLLLKDKKWRINNLYYIKDIKGRRIKFKMNEIQEYVFDNLHYLNVILKARQHGITTLFCLLFLDDALFLMKDVGIIAHTLDDAIKIFNDKVKYAWDNMPEGLKQGFIVEQDNVRTLKFKRKHDIGQIYVGTSLRGGTYQKLHITELGTLDQKYPEKSNEIQTGALNTIHKGQTVTIESTAKGQYGNFYDICKKAMDLRGKELSEMDYKFFFFPWYLKKEYVLDRAIIIPRELQDYFERIENKIGIQLTQGQKIWYFKKKETQKEAMFQEFPSTPEECFMANVEGSYYGKQIDRIREANHITKVPYEPNIQVDTWWDLGIGDSMSIVFTQQSGFEVRIIDYYENSGEGVIHYIKHLKEKQYVYRYHNAPHDIEVRELTTGKTRRETARKLGINFNVIDKLPIEDGIEAVRNLLPRCWFDEERTDHLIKALTEYRKEWDDKLGTFKTRPLHNWASHPADAMRTLGVGIRELIQKKPDYDEEEWYLKPKERKEEQTDKFNPLPELF